MVAGKQNSVTSDRFPTGAPELDAPYGVNPLEPRRRWAGRRSHREIIMANMTPGTFNRRAFLGASAAAVAIPALQDSARADMA